jgi:hypothetical protein
VLRIGPANHRTLQPDIHAFINDTILETDSEHWRTIHGDPLAWWFRNCWWWSREFKLIFGNSWFLKVKFWKINHVMRWNILQILLSWWFYLHLYKTPTISKCPWARYLTCFSRLWRNGNKPYNWVPVLTGEVTWDGQASHPWSDTPEKYWIELSINFDIGWSIDIGWFAM